jgi:O-antigen ligase
MVEQNPFLGIGIGGFRPSVTHYEDTNEEEVQSVAHNTYIELGAEMGLPGLVIFLMMYVSAFRMLERMRKQPGQAGSLTSRVALAIQAGFVGAAACAFFLSAEYEKFPWLFLFLAMTMHNLPRRKRPRKERLTADSDLVGVPVAN